MRQREPVYAYLAPHPYGMEIVLSTRSRVISSMRERLNDLQKPYVYEDVELFENWIEEKQAFLYTGSDFQIPS